MKNTRLTQQDTKLLEEAIFRYGDVISFDELAALTDMDRGYARKRISHLADQGWLVRIKKGLYALADLSSLGFLRLSPYTVAQLLVADSYVSFEAALQQHGMYDQLLQTIVSVTRQQHKAVVLNSYTYRFVKSNPAFFYGWQESSLDSRLVKIATAEKALIDLVMFHRTVYAVDLVLEKLQAHRDELDLSRLTDDLAHSTTTVQRIFGFLFDLAGFDSDALLAMVAAQKGVSRITGESTLFGRKWRLYYDSYFEKYQDTRS
jgi:predicted transcriptional regulator of viral defense system